MIRGAHLLLYSRQAERVRAFLRDVLGLKSVDAGEGWLIFGLPPAEVGVHPTSAKGEEGRVELHLMCDDLAGTLARLAKKGVRATQPIVDRGYGVVTAIGLPDGQELGLYEPRHPTAIAWPGRKAKTKRTTKRATRSRA